jgi:diguanylate cyclase (GGDEF)-like protein
MLGIDWPKLDGRLDGELENGYRLNSLRDDVRQATVGILLLTAAVTLTIPNDFVLIQQPDVLCLIMILRITFVLYSVILIDYLFRIKKPVNYDDSIFVWGLFGIVVCTFIICSRPATFTGHALIDLLVLVLLYLGVPCRLLYRLILAFLFTASCLLLLGINAQQLTTPWITTEIISLVFTNIVGLIISHRLYSYRRKQYAAQVAEGKVKEELKLLASHDSLTGVTNHRSFFEQGERELRRFVRYGKPFSLMVIDIDDFKSINDNYGHSEGDNVLIKLVALIDSQVRQSDVFGRTGGDEFCLLLIETGKAEAMEIAERIRMACSETTMTAGTGIPINFTVSLGLVESSKNDTGIGQIYSMADAAMYRAKREGRNRVSTF